MGDVVVALTIIVLFAWCGIAVLASWGAWHFRRSLSRVPVPRFTAPTAVIIPVRGADNLARLWPALCRQQFPRWRLIFSFEAADDPGYVLLTTLVRTTQSSPETQLIVAGLASDTGQKIHNQLAAVAALKSDDEIIVFADADIIPRPDWLARAVHPLGDPAVAAVSAWVWLVPDDDRLSTSLVCAAHAPNSLFPRARRWTLASGATMAIRRRDFDSIGIAERWHGALSDDLQLTRALWQKGHGVLGPAALLLETRVSYDWREAFAFARRQYLLIRLHMTRYWVIAAGATTIPMLGWIALLGWGMAGHPWFLSGFAGAAILNGIRVIERRRAARLLWPERDYRLRYRLDLWGTPVQLLFHAAVIWSTAFGRMIRWGGRTYRLDAPQELRILSGPGA
jgi:hypothetical protein